MFVQNVEQLVRDVIKTLIHLIPFGYVSAAEKNSMENAAFAEEKEQELEPLVPLELGKSATHALSRILAPFVVNIYKQ